MPPQFPLNSLGQQIEEHWQEHRPKMYRALRQTGQLKKAVFSAQELTSDSLSDLLQKGLPYNQAWELVREEWAFLPSEEDLPTLGFDPANLTPPPSQDPEEITASPPLTE